MVVYINVCVIGLGLMGMGVVCVCLQVGLNIWGVDINFDNCCVLLVVGVKGVGFSVVLFVVELDVVVLLVVNVVQVWGILFGESGFVVYLKLGIVVMVLFIIVFVDVQVIVEVLVEYQLLMFDVLVLGGVVKVVVGDMMVMVFGSDVVFV